MYVDIYNVHTRSKQEQRSKQMRAHLFETLLADRLRVDLHLEDDGIGLADEAPHPRARCSRDDLEIHQSAVPLVVRQLLVTRGEKKGKGRTGEPTL